VVVCVLPLRISICLSSGMPCFRSFAPYVCMSVLIYSVLYLDLSLFFVRSVVMYVVSVVIYVFVCVGISCIHSFRPLFSIH